MKKILFIITKSNWGGAQRYLYDISTNLPKNKFNVSVALGEGGILIDKLKEADIKMHLLKTTKSVKLTQEFKTFFTLLKIIRKERPDIVHLNSSKIGGTGAVAAWLLGVPKIIFTAHGWAFDENRPGWQKILILFLSWVSSLFHHKIICVSEDSKESAKLLGSGYKKCVVIHNAIKKINFETREEARSFFKINFKIAKPENAVWLGTISELTENKGLSYALKALSQIKDMDWLFIIVGEGEQKEKLKKEIQKYNLEKKVHLAGHIDNASRYLKAFDIFTLTSIKEGFPYVLLEAGSAELTVVASDVGGIPEIIKNNKTGIVVRKKNPDAIMKALKKLIKDKKFSEDLGKNLKNKVEKEFIFDTMLEKTEEIYSK